MVLREVEHLRLLLLGARRRGRGGVNQQRRGVAHVGRLQAHIALAVPPHQQRGGRAPLLSGYSLISRQESLSQHARCPLSCCQCQLDVCQPVRHLVWEHRVGGVSGTAPAVAVKDAEHRGGGACQRHVRAMQGALGAGHVLADLQQPPTGGDKH